MPTKIDIITRTDLNRLFTSRWKHNAKNNKHNVKKHNKSDNESKEIAMI